MDNVGEPRHRVTHGDIPCTHWQGGAVDCTACPHHTLRSLPIPLGCEPGHACVQDAYARRIDRFFHWHRDLANDHLNHPYFEVRAIAARYASVFRLSALMDDPDETVRLQVALRLPQTLLTRMLADPHREVRIRVAQRIDLAELSTLINDPDYGVREVVALRLPQGLLPALAQDPDRSVRTRVAQRLDMPALLALASDPEADVRRIVARRLPPALLDRLAHDDDCRVRWEVEERLGTPHPGA
ncbi:MAG TPA: 4Fe4S-binding leucine-rich repeat protein [Burkholderiaceae bacterium]|nr:4Fe4S-binding leucine-rich repeat protein [Burkholderiaceae bacterium]